MLLFNSSTTEVQTHFGKKRGMATALAMIGVSGAMFIWPPVMQYFIEIYSWRGALIIMAGLVLNVIPLSYFFTHTGSSGQEKKEIEDSVENHNQKETPEKHCCLCHRSRTSEKCSTIFGLSVWKNPGFILQTACYFSLSFTYYVCLNFIPARARSIGIDKYPAAFLISIYGIANTVARLFIAFIIDRPKVSRLAMWTATVTGMGVSTICVPLLNDYVSFATGMIVSGFFVGK